MPTKVVVEEKDPDRPFVRFDEVPMGSWFFNGGSLYVKTKVDGGFMVDGGTTHAFAGLASVQLVRNVTVYWSFL